MFYWLRKPANDSFAESSQDEHNNHYPELPRSQVFEFNKTSDQNLVW